MMEQPLLSIVIANYNYGRFLGEAIESVIRQDGFDNCELIVVDGGSTDDSVEVIKKYSNKISWWCSEKDKGQSDAFNKGFSHARGRFLTWLNADDVMLLGTIEAVCNYAQKHPKAEWICGGVVFMDAECRVVKARIGAQVPWFLRKVVPMTCVGGPSSFFSKDRYLQVGKIDEELHYSMDTDLWYKFFRQGVRLNHLNRYFWGFRLHEESKTASTLTTGETKPRYVEEGKIIKARYSVTNAKAKTGERIWRYWKFLTGSLLRSVIDTRRLRNANVHKI